MQRPLNNIAHLMRFRFRRGIHSVDHHVNSGNHDNYTVPRMFRCQPAWLTINNIMNIYCPVRWVRAGGEIVNRSLNNAFNTARRRSWSKLKTARRLWSKLKTARRRSWSQQRTKTEPQPKIPTRRKKTKTCRNFALALLSRHRVYKPRETFLGRF